MTKVKWIDCWKEEKIKCPYCGVILEEADCCAKLHTNTYADVKCPNCGKTFGVIAIINIQYTTVRKDGDTYCDEWEDDDV